MPLCERCTLPSWLKSLIFQEALWINMKWKYEWLILHRVVEKKSEIELALESILTLCRGRVRGVSCVLYFVSCKCHTLAQLMKSFFDSIWHRAKKEEKSTAKDIYLVYSWCHVCSSSSWIHSWIYVCINTRKEKKLPHSRTTLRFLHLMLIGTLIKFVFITWLKCYSIYIKNILFVSRFCFPERCYCDIVCFQDEIKKRDF